MARALSLEVIAEGVENEAQLAELRRLGCDYAQGHLFHAAMPAQRSQPPARRGGARLFGDLARQVVVAEQLRPARGSDSIRSLSRIQAMNVGPLAGVH